MAITTRQHKVDRQGLTYQVKGIEFDDGTTLTGGDLSLLDDVTADAISARVVNLSGTTSVSGIATYVATVTVANGQTVGKEAAIAMPANFLPLSVQVVVTVASTNASNFVDCGIDADGDAFVDGAAVSVATTGFKGHFPCNGVRGNPGGTSNVGAVVTPDEVSVTVSADPGATGVTMRLTFFGIQAS